MTTILDRLKALFDSMMNESDVIPPLFKPVANNLVNNFLKSADPKQVETYIKQVRDEIIPWLLGETEEVKV